MKLDIEAIAREAELIEPRDVWADLPADYRQALCIFAALVLEKVADHLQSNVHWTKPHSKVISAACAEIRHMAAGMGE